MVREGSSHVWRWVELGSIAIQPAFVPRRPDLGRLAVGFVTYTLQRLNPEGVMAPGSSRVPT